MDFRNARARQPEIVRSVQKDARYTNELAEDLSDVLRLTGPRNWIKYNQMCRLLAELSYHGFASANNLQTLGEEYTGIIQVDGNYKQIPSRLLQLIAIVLEFGGDSLFQRLMQKLDTYVSNNEEIRPKVKPQLKKIIQKLRQSPSYVKALHKSLFYLDASKYQLSKRTTGINYVLIRHWLQPEFSLYGYKILGVITFLQVTVSLAISGWDAWREHKRQQLESIKQAGKKFLQRSSSAKDLDPNTPQCILCLEPRSNNSLTPCGHIFCWSCLLEWLEERDECPLCRESLKKSQVILLQNYA
ncbi:peroxisome biogenesis factor 10 [Drosophila sechellia]|uniref:RING-type E3 ubiquitin transferase n=1 Tax=Drosophila sechellia TaxID=7238 RepID=B4HVV1_DROSE|nr:peroxisome biogenesis factor 10 [Drosophila sechellia]EDW50066.1 GM14421 [Drosophila sechellia]